MQEYYSLLGVLPTATADEIEEAYQNKRRELSPERFEQGTLEWLRAFATLKELDKAHDNAIMATFAPIRAFSDPLPPLPRPPAPQNKTEPRQAQPQIQPQPQIQQARFESKIQAQVRPQPASPVSHDSSREATSARSYRPSSESSLEGSELRGLVEEVPVSFSDAQLLQMDIQDLRESYAPKKEESAFLTLGIEDKLLRYYVKAYLGFALLDLFMRLALGMAWVGMSETFNHYAAFLKATMPSDSSFVQALKSAPSPSLFVSIAASLISMAYLFFCSLPMPIVARFFILGQPPEKGVTRWALAFTSIVVALGLYSLTGFLFRFLPAAWAGSGTSLIFIAPPLCLVTMRYEGS
ncbi:MAG: J domain-containing protein [Synergistaceae bacterium]|jgi:hypothetical protein|nr:J domain-containing protein [Synergistaceae bacterium]